MGFYPLGVPGLMLIFLLFAYFLLSYNTWFYSFSSFALIPRGSEFSLSLESELNNYLNIDIFLFTFIILFILMSSYYIDSEF